MTISALQLKLPQESEKTSRPSLLQCAEQSIYSRRYVENSAPFLPFCLDGDGDDSEGMELCTPGPSTAEIAIPSFKLHPSFTPNFSIPQKSAHCDHNLLSKLGMCSAAESLDQIIFVDYRGDAMEISFPIAEDEEQEQLVFSGEAQGAWHLAPRVQMKRAPRFLVHGSI